MKDFELTRHFNRLIFLSASISLLGPLLDAVGMESLLPVLVICLGPAIVSLRVFRIDGEPWVLRVPLIALSIVFALILYWRPVERNIYSAFLPGLGPDGGEFAFGALIISLVCILYFISLRILTRTAVHLDSKLSNGNTNDDLA